jgi:hypothetical protein
VRSERAETLDVRTDNRTTLGDPVGRILMVEKVTRQK